ncbi:putative SAM-dependent methyltransferases/tRNA (uracil-5-)-methyltransferase family protein [Treponema sp. JC4]|uniref:class I SAM-dependent RNA methyltransferase n=1 Tax=Treponema sp. JC4 TaxID=1124982 RepID=UPI00025B0E3B|nr:methyltransferase [Treponema sp. JC4]EID84621.1 putative SAM-dependent methyltransferases/tRNA (uracil-5-)-methyltransferase family protein [Treponema sp. JC4]
MNIITDKIVFGGKTLTKIDGKTVFIPYTMPGEELEIKITEEKRDYNNAEIVNIIKPSEHRVKAACPYYEKCGGCNMMHIEPAYQRELRKQMLTDIFLQNGIDISDKVEIVYDRDTNYRCRFQLNDGGLSQKNANVIIPVENCLCAEEPVNAWLKETPAAERGKGRTHLFGSSFMVSNGQNSGKLIVADESGDGKKSGIVVKGSSKKKLKLKENKYFSGTMLSPKNTVTVCIGGKNLSFDVRGFFQSNLFVFEKVVKLICDTLGAGERVLDMYSGCGSISAFLADKFNQVVLVEHNRDALVFAEQNMAGKGHVSYGLSGANWVKNCASMCGDFDACVIDPPRSGMEKEVCDYLCKSGIPQIRSLSCDPATHARDSAKLIAAGYSLEAIYLLDFYPNTSHIESLAVFVK